MSRSKRAQTEQQERTAESARGGRFKWHVPSVELDDIRVRVNVAAVNS